MRLPALLAALALAAPALHAATRYVQEPQIEACARWEETEKALMAGRLEGKAARASFKEWWKLVVQDDLPSPAEGRWQWMFPLPGHDAQAYGESYNPDDYRYLDGPKAKGFPALRIYLRDRARTGLDERTGKPAPVVAATDGVVLSARKHWASGDPDALGNYVLVLDQHDKLFFYYAHLAKLRVSVGQLVSKGEVLGWLGRSGREIEAKRLGTQLRFEVHTFDDGLFYPVYPGRALRVASQVEWPLQEREFHPRIKPPKTPLPSPSLPGKIAAPDKP